MVENPAERDKEVSIFKLDEWDVLSRRAHVHRNTIAQCHYGAQHAKLTEFRGNVELKNVYSKCEHVPQDIWLDSENK